MATLVFKMRSPRPISALSARPSPKAAVPRPSIPCASVSPSPPFPFFLCFLYEQGERPSSPALP